MAETTLKVNAVDNATPTIKGLTQSILGAGLAFSAIMQALQILIKAGEEAIKEWNLQEKALVSLKAIVGENVYKYAEYARKLQEITNVQDDVILSAMKMGLTFGITTEKINEATREALGLSKAYGIELNVAMKLIAMANEGNYQRLARYIPELKNASSEEQKHALLLHAVAVGMQETSNEMLTFAGIVETDKRVTEDLDKNFGRMITTIGGPFVAAGTEAKKSILSFVESKGAIDAMSITFAILASVCQLIKVNFELAAIPIVFFMTAIKNAGKAIDDVIHGNFKDLPNVFKAMATDMVEYAKKIGTDAVDAFAGFGKNIDAFKKKMTTIQGTQVKETAKTANEMLAITVEQYKEESKALTEYWNLHTFFLQKGMANAGTIMGGMKGITDAYYSGEINAATTSADRKKQLQIEQFNVNKAFSIGQAIMGTAQAAISGFSTVPFFPVGIAMGALALAMGGIQIGVIAGTPMPAFAEGGVVGGNSYSGDGITARVNSGEMILTVAQQKALLAGKSGTTINHYGNVIASDPMEYNRKIQIQTRRLEAARGVVR